MVTDNVVVTTTDYAGSYIYENSSLKFMNHPEGYIEPDGAGSYHYVYQYKDHLGNVRLSYSDSNGDGLVDVNEIMSEKNYYPFGLKHRGYNAQVNGTYHPYGFNGKEEQGGLDLKWLDFGARNYDAALGRWMNFDPLAEEMRRHSPYNYGFDNPVYFIDPDGRAPTDEWNKNADGSLTWVSNKGGDTTDYVNNLDQDGNVVSTDVYEVETTSDVSSTQEVDLNVRLPGINHTVKAGADPRIQEADLGDAVSEVVEAVGEEIGISPVVMAAVMIVINPKKAAKQVKKAKDVKKQASEIKNTLNGGKNSVTIKTTNGHTRYDLEGKAHGGVETPHKQSYKKNTDPNTGKTNISRTSKRAEPMNQQDIRTVRKTLEKRKQEN